MFGIYQAENIFFFENVVVDRKSRNFCKLFLELSFANWTTRRLFLQIVILDKNEKNDFQHSIQQQNLPHIHPESWMKKQWATKEDGEGAVGACITVIS